MTGVASSFGQLALARYVWRCHRVPGWTRGWEAVALATAAYALPNDATIVEIGSFAGGSAVLLAGARKLRRSGRVYCVDPFDARGDSHSAAAYATALRSLRRPQRAVFDDNLRAAGVAEWVTVLPYTAEDAARRWTGHIDLLFLDGDQSREGAMHSYEAWEPFLRPGSTLAVHNSAPGDYAVNHDGSLRLVESVVVAPRFDRIRRVGTTTLAVRSP